MGEGEGEGEGGSGGDTLPKFSGGACGGHFRSDGGFILSEDYLRETFLLGGKGGRRQDAERSWTRANLLLFEEDGGLGESSRWKGYCQFAKVNPQCSKALAGFLECAMRWAGAPLARFPVRRDYKAVDIVKTIKDAISPG